MGDESNQRWCVCGCVGVRDGLGDLEVVEWVGEILERYLQVEEVRFGVLGCAEVPVDGKQVLILSIWVHVLIVQTANQPVFVTLSAKTSLMLP